jgi:hypothetical protein
MTIASAAARMPCTLARASSPVIHRDDPSRAATFPSRVAAIFTVTSGIPVRTCFANAAFCRAAAWARSGVITAIPARRRRAKPRPSTTGLGSVMAATTLATPKRSMARVQGGVRPWWSQGSSVT